MSNAKTTDVQDFLDAQPFSAYQWLLFAVCFLIILMDGFDTAAIGFIAPSLMTEWGIAKPALAPVLSAALFGLAFGALSAGPLADRFGRKIMLCLAVSVMGVGSLISGHAANLEELTLWRFITGLGLGAAMPNAVTLMNEYCPKSKRAVITNTMFSGFPIGSALGGFFAAWLIPQYGWRSLLILGGILPLVLVVVAMVVMPESVRFLTARKNATHRVRTTLARISSTALQFDHFTLRENAVTQGGGLRTVLSPRYLLGSLMLWLAYFMGLVIIYGLVNWMPVLFKEAGIPPAKAAMIAALFQLGGLGTILFGYLMDRGNPNKVIAWGYLLSCLSVALVGQTIQSSLLALITVVFIGGFIMNATQASMPQLAASYYPTMGRATGVAWMMGIGRFGGIAGSFLVAELSRQQLALPHVFLVVGLPGVVAALAIWAKNKWGQVP